MKYQLTLEWLDGREEQLVADGYCIMPKDSTLTIQLGTDGSCLWRVHHLSQFRNVEIRPDDKPEEPKRVIQ